METFLNQLPTLLGVLLGSAGTLLATTFADRARWARTQSVRWDERRLEAYADYARAIKEIQAVVFRLVAEHRPGSPWRTIDRQTGLDLMAQVEVRRTTLWEAVLLLGDEPTVSAAREWNDAVRRLQVIARGDEPGTVTLEPAVRQADEARDAFYVAARQSLAVGGGNVAQVTWLDARRLRPPRPAEAGDAAP